MTIAHKVAAGLAAVALGMAIPASAAPGGMGGDEAEKLRRLDIMLMVTGLRCRTTASNFQGDYGNFTTRHLSELNAASDRLKSDLAQRYGAAGANRALDRISVSMANTYGQGHPWLDCAQLKTVTRSLAASQGSAPLVAAADQLLGAAPVDLALASR